MIVIEPINESYVRINCEYHILRELKDSFSYTVPNCKHMPKYKAGIWDGNISMINLRNATVYKGLVPDILQWAIDREYKITVDKSIVAPFKENIDFSITDLKLPFIEHDFQDNAIKIAAKKKRTVILSSTGSGKSVIIYGMIRMIQDVTDMKILVMVPYLSLVDQLYGDFEDYSVHNGWSTSDNCHRIPTDKSKTTDKQVVITTWQSMQNMPATYFQQFGAIICDEVHTYYQKASDLKVCARIIESCTNAFFRFGLTGTIDDGNVIEMQLKGMFGPIRRVSSTKDLMDREILSSLSVYAILLKHNDETAKLLSGAKYRDEVMHIIQMQRRNDFISNLARTRKGNTLILFQYVEKHGKPFFKQLKDECEGKQVFFVYGGTAADQRNNIRKIAETHNDVIILASYATFSTGVNIVNLHNIIFASPTKAKIRVLQSVGRSLRKGENKTEAALYDIGDDTRGKRKTHNYTLKHFVERYNIYVKEGFKVTVKEYNL